MTSPPAPPPAAPGWLPTLPTLLASARDDCVPPLAIELWEAVSAPVGSLADLPAFLSGLEAEREGSTAIEMAVKSSHYPQEGVRVSLFSACCKAAQAAGRAAQRREAFWFVDPDPDLVGSVPPPRPNSTPTPPAWGRELNDGGPLGQFLVHFAQAFAESFPAAFAAPVANADGRHPGLAALLSCFAHLLRVAMATHDQTAHRRTAPHVPHSPGPGPGPGAQAGGAGAGSRLFGKPGESGDSADLAIGRADGGPADTFARPELATTGVGVAEKVGENRVGSGERKCRGRGRGPSIGGVV
jgi:hypothetical protein